MKKNEKNWGKGRPSFTVDSKLVQTLETIVEKKSQKSKNSTIWSTSPRLCDMAPHWTFYCTDLCSGMFSASLFTNLVNGHSLNILQLRINNEDMIHIKCGILLQLYRKIGASSVSDTQPVWGLRNNNHNSKYYSTKRIKYSVWLWTG